MNEKVERLSRVVTEAANRPLDAMLTADGLAITVASMDGATVIDAAAMVLCTGLVDDDWLSADPLLARLVERKLAVAHSLNIGSAIGPTGCVIGPDGSPIRGLWAIGPLRRAAEWETTAIPEIRRQAADLAMSLASNIPATRLSPYVDDRCPQESLTTVL